LIERRFLDWKETALPLLARRLLEERAGPSVFDLTGDLFVLPGGRPARRWIEILVEAAENRGLSLLPPGTSTPGALPEFLYRPSRPPGDRVSIRRAWSRALATTPPTLLEHLLPDPPDPDEPVALDELAAIVEDLHYELMREGIFFREVAEHCAPELLFDDSERWGVLDAVQERYTTILEAWGMSDPFVNRIEALEGSRIQPPASGPEAIERIHLVGVVELPGLTREMVERVARKTRVIAWIHAPEGIGDRFDGLGCVRPEAWGGVSVPLSSEHLSVRDGPGEQADEVLRGIGELEGTRAPDEIVVGAPDQEVIPWLEQRLGAHGLPYRVAAGTPLERTAPYRLLEAVASYLEGRRFSDLAALLRHPDFGEEIVEENGLARLDRYHAERLPSRTPDLPALLERLHGSQGLAPLDGDPAEGAKSSLAETMPRILEFLARNYGRTPLDRNDPGHAETVEILVRIREAAAAFYRLPTQADLRCTPAEAIRLLLAELRDPQLAVPPQPRRSAVEILGWLELHLDDAPALLLTGANEGRLPASVTAHPFLPDRLRTRLGIPDDASRRARDTYLLTAILESRRVVRVVAGRRSAAGDPLRPSRLLLPRDDDEELARHFLHFTEADPKPPAPLRPPGVRTAAKSGFQTPPEPELRLAEVPSTFHVTEFRTLLTDPYRWVLERRMGLEAVSDEARELDGRAFGTLAHRVLEAFARTEEAGSPDPEAAARRLDRLLDRSVERRLDPDPLPAVPLQVEQLRRRLHAFAAWHARRLSEGWRVIAAEAAPPDGGVPLDVDGAPVRIMGRVDRIEAHGERGELALFDYKTGDSPRDPDRAHRSRQGEWRDLQLPLYRHLLPHLLDRDGGRVAPELDGLRVRLGYIHLPGSVEGVGARIANWDDEVLASALDRARSAIRALRRDPVIPFDPEASRPSRWDPLAPLLSAPTQGPGPSEGTGSPDAERSSG